MPYLSSNSPYSSSHSPCYKRLTRSSCHCCQCMVHFLIHSMNLFIFLLFLLNIHIIILIGKIVEFLFQYHQYHHFFNEVKEKVSQFYIDWTCLWILVSKEAKKLTMDCHLNLDKVHQQTITNLFLLPLYIPKNCPLFSLLIIGHPPPYQNCYPSPTQRTMTA